MKWLIQYQLAILVLFGTVLVYCCYAYIQPTYTYALTDSRLDAHQYAKAYDYFRGLVPTYDVRFPFNSRILTAFLASKLPFEDIKTNYLVLNGTALALTTLILTIVWQQLQIRQTTIFIGLFFLLFHWKGPLRMYLPDPISADVLGYFFGSLWLLVSLDSTKKFSFVLMLIAILATLQKESFIVITVIYCFMNSINRQYFRFHNSYLLFTISTYLIASYYFPASNPDWRNNPIIGLVRGVVRYTTEPSLFLKLPISWLFAFGGFWVSVVRGKWSVVNSRQFKDNENTKRNISYLICGLSLAWLFLSAFAGGDTTRILMTAAPFIYTYLLLKINEKSLWVSYFALFWSIPLMRLNSLEPDLGLYKSQSYQWCVECWGWTKSWPYLCYIAAMFVTYLIAQKYYLLALRWLQVRIGQK